MIYFRSFGINPFYWSRGFPALRLNWVMNIHHERDEFGVEPWTSRGGFKREKERVFWTRDGFRINIQSHSMIDELDDFKHLFIQGEERVKGQAGLD